MAFIEIDLVGEEELGATDDNEQTPETFEEIDDLDHLYMDEQLYLQSIFEL